MCPRKASGLESKNVLLRIRQHVKITGNRKTVRVVSIFPTETFYARKKATFAKIVKRRRGDGSFCRQPRFPSSTKTTEETAGDIQELKENVPVSPFQVCGENGGLAAAAAGRFSYVRFCRPP